MNEKFLSLPEEKQQRIINAGFQVFAHFPYKKAPVSEIAANAGISKSLLFHYFHNKKDFYFFLWQKVEDISMRYMSEHWKRISYHSWISGNPSIIRNQPLYNAHRRRRNE